MNTQRLLTVGLSLMLTAMAQAVPPSISNVSASQRVGTKFVDIHYDLADPDSGALTVQIEISSNSGQSYDLPVHSVSGAVGAGVAPGNNRVITWNAGLDWNGNFSDTCRVRLYAFDGSTPVPPLGMCYIPAGTFVMGWESTTVIGGNMTLTKSYFMDRYEVTGNLWNEVRNWANANGYSIGAGSFRASGHPVQSVSWDDCVKWCNARSEKEGLTFCYYADAARTIPYKTGYTDFANTMVDWNANGYRLPTETEWERAARGGLDRKVYPWGDTVAAYHANFSGSGDPFAPAAGPETTPVGYYNGNQIPAGPNMANGYGLYDMAGNVWEWCWDRENGLTFGLTDYRGINSGSFRRVRGGGFNSGNTVMSCAWRNQPFSNLSPTNYNNSIGFRSVRGQ